MRFRPVIILSVIISLISTILLLIHLFYPAIPIDLITLTLFLIAVAPWAGQIFYSIKMPGGIEVVYRELKQINENLVTENLIAEPTEKTDFFISDIKNPVYRISYLRIEIYRRLRILAESYGIDTNRMRGYRVLGRKLHDVGGLTARELGIFERILDISNKAIYSSSEIKEAVASWAFEEGPKLIAGLDRKIAEKKSVA